MIERYLCVGGIEIANPCRTLAYLSNLGMPCLVTPPTSDDCCCCPDWLPEAAEECALTVEFGFGDAGCVLYPDEEVQSCYLTAGWLEDGEAAGWAGYPGWAYIVDLSLTGPPSMSGWAIDYVPDAPLIVGVPTVGDVPVAGWQTYVASQTCPDLLMQAGNAPGDVTPGEPLWMRISWESAYGCSYEVPIYFPAGWPSSPPDLLTCYVLADVDGIGGDAFWTVSSNGYGAESWSSFVSPAAECVCVESVLYPFQSVTTTQGNAVATLYAITDDDCVGFPDAPPPPSDPAWQLLGSVPVAGVSQTLPLALLQENTPGCAYLRYDFTVPGTGIACSGFVRFIDGEGEYEASADGLTWTPTATIECVAECSPGDAEYTATIYADAGESESCLGPYSITGGAQPMTVSIYAAFTVGDPIPASMPALGSGSWLLAGSAPFDTTMPMVGCGQYGQDEPGFYRFSYLTAEGYSFDVVFALAYETIAPGDWSTSAVSFDGGVTWQPIVDGYTSHTYTFGGGGVAGEFTTPTADDAPWYDAAVPESADVLGVWIEEATLGVPWRRDARDRQRGASLSPGRLGGRELTISGWLYARTEAATAYGRQWLFEALAGDSCDGNCDLPDASIWTHCDVETENAGRRTMRRVGLTGWDPNIEPDYPRTCGFKFEATLTAEVPELLLDPVVVWQQSLDPALLDEAFCNLCRPCPSSETTICDCGAYSEALRVAPSNDLTSAYCEPILMQRACVQIEPPALWRDATAIITVDAGSWPGDPARPGVKNLRVRGWQNPTGATDYTQFDCADPCLDVEIACIAGGAQLVIDGTTRSAMVLCEETQRNGYAYLSSGGGRRFAWPDVSCHGLMLCVETDALNTADGTAITIELVARERG